VPRANVTSFVLVSPSPHLPPYFRNRCDLSHPQEIPCLPHNIHKYDGLWVLTSTNQSQLIRSGNGSEAEQVAYKEKDHTVRLSFTRKYEENRKIGVQL
jgi:hypothetical protein